MRGIVKKRTVTYMTKEHNVKSSDIQEAVQQLKKPFIVEMKAEIKSEKGDTATVDERVKSQKGADTLRGILGASTPFLRCGKQGERNG